jgi:signal transduction histidine kinase
MSELIGTHGNSTTGGLGDGRLTHDVRQSLAVLRALVTLVESASQLEGETAEQVRLIQHEVDWIAEMVGCSGAGTDDEVVDIGDVVCDAITPLSQSSTCEVRLSREPGLSALADPVELQRATRNLVDNAIRAAGPQGHVDVSVATRGDDVVVEVGDDGPGFGRMPTQQGLGLVTVHHFVSRFHGSLDVGSAPRGGALLTLRLPLLPTYQLPEQRRSA